MASSREGSVIPVSNLLARKMVELASVRRLQLVNEPGIRSTFAGSRVAARDLAAVSVVAAALVALICKLALAYNTFGTNDVTAFYMFARSLNEHGLKWTYAHCDGVSSNLPLFNHPPLTGYYLELIEAASRQEFFRAYGLTFPFLLRLPGIVADFVVVLVLLRLRKIDIYIPAWALMLFALSPVSLMVSGFHGNTDALMVMFLVLAVASALRAQPLVCGIFFALSCQIKVIPLLFLPALFFFWWRRGGALQFTMLFLLVMIALWLQPLLQCSALFFTHVFGYGSYWGTWGITYLLRLTGWPQFNGSGGFHLPPAAAAVALALKCLIVALTIALACRRRFPGEKALIESMAYTSMIFFVFSPGVAPQYLIWLAPLVLILSPAIYIGLAVTSSMFLFVFYNVTAGGLPWYSAVSTNAAEMIDTWTPWSLWPWATLLLGLAVNGSRAFFTDPARPLFGSKAMSTVSS
jgi:hypothetical protein